MILDWQKTEELLKKYNIPAVESRVIESIKQGIEFTQKFGWPVVVKVLSKTILHKTDEGLVRTNIQDEAGLERAFFDLFQKEGEVLIQRQLSGIEIFCGVKRDASFGPVVAFGLGGVFVEVLEDVVFGLAPLNQQEAENMVKSIKGYKLLQGYRGQKEADIVKIAELLVNVCQMAMENKDIKEIDFNPVFAASDFVAVADAKILI